MNACINGTRTFLAVLVLALAACGGAEDTSDDAPEGPTQQIGLDLRGAIWMEADPGRNSFLVLNHRSLEGKSISEVVELGADGAERNRWSLASLNLGFNWPAPAPTWFAASGKLVIAALADKAAWTLDVRTGQFQKLSSNLDAVAVDKDSGRLYFGEGASLRIVDATSGQTLGTHALPQPLPMELTVGTDGSLNFLLSAGDSLDWFHITKPGYALEKQTISGDGEVRLEAVDDQRRRAFVQHSSIDEAYLEVVAWGAQTRGQANPRVAEDLFFPRVSGIWKGSPWIWIQNDLGALPPGVEEPAQMWLYEAESLSTRHSMPAALDETRDELQRGPRGQLVVLHDSTRLQSWDSESFQVTKTLDLPGATDTWACNWQTGQAAFVTFIGDQASLVRVDLNTLQLMP